MNFCGLEGQRSNPHHQGFCPAGAPPSRNQPIAAFSLVELIVVVAVVAILITLGISGVNSVTRGMAIEMAGQQVADAVLLTRENAVAKNRKAELRFIKAPSSDGSFLLRSVQPWIIKDDAGNKVPIGRVTWLPETVTISEKAVLSPLLSTNVQFGTMQVSGLARDYVAVTYRADGSLDGSPSGSNTFLTIVPLQDADATAVPSNYRSLSINPVTGKVRIFHP